MCQEAGLSFSNITERAFWDAKYSSGRVHYSLHDPLYGRRGLLAKTLLPWVSGAGDVLEIGCGSSRYMMFFKMVAGLDTYGIDFSVEGLQRLEEMAASHGIRHKLYYGDLFENELEGRKFNVVFHSGLVEHFSDLGLFFERCRFFCKQDGLLIFLLPNMQNLAWKWHSYLCPVNFRSHIPYTRDAIVQGLRSLFNVVYARPWGYPQVYAGGPPESMIASMFKYVNLGIMLWISFTVFGYRGSINSCLSSSWLFICKAR